MQNSKKTKILRWRQGRLKPKASEARALGPQTLGLRSRPQRLLIYTTCFYFKQSLIDSAVAKRLAHFSILVHGQGFKTYVLHFRFNFSKIINTHFPMFE
jgi:hypothetical protein